MGLYAMVRPTMLKSVYRKARLGLPGHRWLEAAAVFLASSVVFGIVFRLSMGTFLRDNLAVCWPLAGIEAATLLLVPRRLWPWVLAGLVASHLFMERHVPPDEMVVDAVCDLAEVMIAGFALPAFQGLGDWMKQPLLLRRFIIWPVLLGPALTALPVAAVYSRETHAGFWVFAARWCLGDTLGTVLWLPMTLAIFSRETYALFAWKALPKTVSLIGILGAMGALVFLVKSVPVAFVLMPMLLLIALKLGLSGSAIAVNLLSILTAEGTLRGMGPFHAIREPFNVMTLQAFLAVAMLMCFPICIILLERDTFEQETKDAYRRMELLAISDGLTGLANRRRFDEEFDEEWRRAMRERNALGMMMVDVDCFKLYNDVYGHVKGDECLRCVAGAIASKVRRAGDLVARYGGEEFVVLMPSTDLAGVMEAAERIRAEVESLQLEHRRNPHKRVTVSIGCWSVVPNPAMGQDTLLELADRGLYAAKQRGRNRVEMAEAAVRSPVQAISG